MTHDDAFLQAINESPDDDSLRLIYADWLEDNGQTERAEFIRVQCELARLPENHPRRPELDARERELLRKDGEKWAGPVSRWVIGWEFRRGFVDGIQADRDLLLAHAANLFSAVPLRRVTLNGRLGPSVRHVTPLPGGPLPRRLAAAYPHLARLSAADFSDNYNGDAGLAALADSPIPFRVWRLDLAGTHTGWGS